MTRSEIKYWISGLLLADILSFLAYYEPALSPLFFALLVAVFLFVCAKNLELATLIVLLELFIGSKGYLFSINLGGFEISIRLAFFIILLSFSLRSFIISSKRERWLFFQWSKPMLFLGFIVVLASAHGLLRAYGFGQVFFDANGYFFIGLTLPLFIAATNEGFMGKAISLLVFSAVYLSVKTLLLLYFFTHHFGYFIFDLYSWMRYSGIGEITWTSTGAWRVFIQSQMYIIVAWWVMLMKIWLDKPSWKTIWPITAMGIFASALLISFSRSFWLGLLISGLAVGLWTAFTRRWREGAYFVSMLAASVILSLIITIAVLKIPFPTASSTGTIDLSERFDLTIEEAASSRWNLLPPLWKAVKQNLIFGAGFGAPVTYVSNDPRIRSINPTGLYTTTSFEWGYLDIWLKIGILGLLIYTWIVAKIFIEANRFPIGRFGEALGLIFGLIAILGVNIGSPYLNHPLGLGLVLLLYVYFVKRIKISHET